MCPNFKKRNGYMSIGKHGELGSIVRPQGARHSFLFWSKGAFLHFLFPLLSAKIWIWFDSCHIQQWKTAGWGSTWHRDSSLRSTSGFAETEVSAGAAVWNSWSLVLSLQATAANAQALSMCNWQISHFHATRITLTITFAFASSNIIIFKVRQSKAQSGTKQHFYQ